mmetsp:Transcript_10229/g.30360  ORF Transcript_10229/g.30360 Transcript_10229/m.30360 type:complete len:251 (-) Transcript_10229:385-1137(-)
MHIRRASLLHAAGDFLVVCGVVRVDRDGQFVGAVCTGVYACVRRPGARAVPLSLFVHLHVALQHAQAHVRVRAYLDVAGVVFHPVHRRRKAKQTDLHSVQGVLQRGQVPLGHGSPRLVVASVAGRLALRHLALRRTCCGRSGECRGGLPAGVLLLLRRVLRALHDIHQPPGVHGCGDFLFGVLHRGAPWALFNGGGCAWRCVAEEGCAFIFQPLWQRVHGVRLRLYCFHRRAILRRLYGSPNRRQPQRAQ